VFVKHEGAFNLRGSWTQHEIGPGRTDYANPDTGATWGRSRVLTDGNYQIHVYASDGKICAKGYATAPPQYESWIARLRFRLGL
jgi:hypothetical protein